RSTVALSRASSARSSWRAMLSWPSSARCRAMIRRRSASVVVGVVAVSGDTVEMLRSSCGSLGIQGVLKRPDFLPREAGLLGESGEEVGGLRNAPRLRADRTFEPQYHPAEPQSRDDRL